MAVYKRTYRGYSGPITPTWSRFLVLYRYSRRNLFRSKMQTAFFVLCFFFPLLCLLGLYANVHLSAFAALAQRSGPLLVIDSQFFLIYLNVQCILAFILTAFLGPGLVSPDLANGALTLYLCRPVSRTEYVLGKMSVIVIVLSWITWIPGLLLFIVQSSLVGGTWFSQNFFMAVAVFLGSWIWIITLALLALALSAWVKWRIAAGALLLAILFMGSGFAHAINSVLNTNQGYLIDISRLTNVIWHSLLRDTEDLPLSATECWIALVLIATSCLYLLMKKVRANEVIR
jgi:ABC-2 type transport system permease protein